jgi:perosamine synthetase
MWTPGRETDAGSVVPHNRLTHDSVEVDRLAEVVRSGYWACGPKTTELEAALRRRAGVEHAVCVASGSAALRLCLQSLSVGSGDSVLIPAYCCVALVNAVLARRALPVPVDIRPSDWNLDPEAVADAAAAKRARVVIVVNTFGSPGPVRPLKDLGLTVIEDCAHALGLNAEDGPLGGRADLAITSFYATKLIGAGEGGAVLTDVGPFAEIVREWRDYTDRSPDPDRRNEKMSDLEAALALCQLHRLDGFLARRACCAARYHELLAAAADRSGAFQLPELATSRVWYRYAVALRDQRAIDVIEAMAAEGVMAEQPICDWRRNVTQEHPTANRAYQHLVSLPCYPSLTEAEQERTAAVFLKSCRHRQRP